MAAIRRGVAASEGLKRFARRTAQALSRDLDRSPNGGPAAVHDARKRIKQLRALLRMIRPAIGKQAFKRDDRQLRRVHHMLADARRSAATKDALDKLEGFAREQGADSGLKVIRRSVRQNPARGNGADLETAVRDAKPLAAAFAERIDRWRMPKRDVTLYVEGMCDSYDEARKELRRGFKDQDVERLHEARKALIQFRYQLDMIAPLWPTMLNAWAEDLQGLREILGDLGDLGDLEAKLAATGEAKVLKNGASDLIAARRAALMAAAEPQAMRLFAERPAALGSRLTTLWKAHETRHG